MEFFDRLWDGSGLAQLAPGQAAMMMISLGLLMLAIKKRFEPLLLVPIGFGGLLSNIPGVDIAVGNGILHLFYVSGVETGAFDSSACLCTLTTGRSLEDSTQTSANPLALA